MRERQRTEAKVGPAQSVRFHAQGHPNISATHHNTLEFTIDPEITQSGTCIVGVRADADPRTLLAIRGPVRVTLRCGDATDTVHATMNPYYIVGDPLILRIHPEPQHRSLCIAADKGSDALDRALVAALRAPGALLEVTIEADEERKSAAAPGVLFVIGTPIGDRRDLSPRAEATLRSVDLILAEDTRTTLALLGQDCPSLMSFHDHNERRRLPEVIARLDAGQRIALVSEAGMPLLSDPGFQIVRAAAAGDKLIVPVPGPDAMTAALSVSGLPVNDFRFLGFLPRKVGERHSRLQEIAGVPYSTVLFEAPHRIVDTLESIADTLGTRAVAACRNLTKPGEEVLRGSAREIAYRLSERDVVRGEFTLVIAPATPKTDNETSEELHRVAESLVGAGVPTKTIADALAHAAGASRRDMFAAVLAIKDAKAATGESD